MNILIVTKNNNYLGDVLEFIKETREEKYNAEEKVLYITMEKPYATISLDMSSHGLMAENFFVIGPVSKSEITEPDIHTNCIYLPKNDMASDIPPIMDLLFSKFTFCSLVFDSLSAFTKTQGNIGELIHTLLRKRQDNVCCIFICKNSDLEEEWMSGIKQAFDKIVTI
ncbi:MAG: hypothetical protein ABIB71_05045 [Candidatus Woesearchaeota archaeon]